MIGRSQNLRFCDGFSREPVAILGWILQSNGDWFYVDFVLLLILSFSDIATGFRLLDSDLSAILKAADTELDINRIPFVLEARMAIDIRYMIYIYDIYNILLYYII